MGGYWLDTKLCIADEEVRGRELSLHDRGLYSKGGKICDEFWVANRYVCLNVISFVVDVRVAVLVVVIILSTIR